jgi:hypothetical protein
MSKDIHGIILELEEMRELPMISDEYSDHLLDSIKVLELLMEEKNEVSGLEWEKVLINTSFPETNENFYRNKSNILSYLTEALARKIAAKVIFVETDNFETLVKNIETYIYIGRKVKT